MTLIPNPEMAVNGSITCATLSVDLTMEFSIYIYVFLLKFLGIPALFSSLVVFSLVVTFNFFISHCHTTGRKILQARA